MPHLNVCSFMGHVGQSPTQKTSKDGAKTWSEFSLAVSTGSKAEPKTMWVKCRVFGNSAGKVAEMCNKGDAMYVSGKLDVNAYARKQDNQPAADVSLLVNEWHWLKPSSKADATDLANSIPSKAPAIGTDEFELPF